MRERRSNHDDPALPTLSCGAGACQTMATVANGGLMTTAVERINDFLTGSPYLLPENEEGDEAAKRAAKNLQNLGRRTRRLHEAIREQSEVLKAQVAEDMAVRRVYESNALEGLGADLPTTHQAITNRGRRTVEDMLRERSVSGGLQAEPKLKDVYALDDAYRFADELSHTVPINLTEIDLRSMQGLITEGKLFAGNYKQQEVRIKGSRHQPVPVIDVQNAVRDMLNWVNTTKAPPALKAAVVHAWLTHIHPFEDGNGRTARVLANIMLACEGYPALIVRSAPDKGAYLTALGASDEAGNLLQFLDLFVKALGRGVYELERPDVSRDLLLRDLYGTTEPHYLAWRDLLGRFGREVELKLQNTRVRFEVVGGLSPSDVKLLQGLNRAGNGWYARVRGPRISMLLWFGFNTLLYRDQVGVDDPWPSIFFSERNRAAIADHPYTPLGDTGRFELDEVVLQPGQRRPVSLRQGLFVRDFTLEESANLFVRALMNFVTKGETA